MAGFVVNNNESTRRVPAHRRVVARISLRSIRATTRWRKTCRSHANARRFAAPGAIPTLDFLLYGFGAAVKKVGVKIKDWTRRRTQHRSPHGAKRNAGIPTPDFAALHPGFCNGPRLVNPFLRHPNRRELASVRGRRVAAT